MDAPFDIVRASHIEYVVTDIDEARRYYSATLGMVETASEGSRVYLRGIEDRTHHSLVLTEGRRPGLSHMAFRLRSELDMKKAERFLEAEGIRHSLAEGEEKGIGPSLRFQDPSGFPVELFYRTDAVEWELQKYHSHHGGRIMRIDHFNVLVPDVAGTVKWYVEKLHFALSEFTEDDDGSMQAAWLRRKQSSHDIAVMRGHGPRFHHAGFIVSDRDSILDCADILSSSGYFRSIERGPGRHGITNAFFLYLRDSDRHRIELYTGDYMAADPDLQPVRWSVHDPRRQTFWGAPTPESWTNEASDVIPFDFPAHHKD
ncbi:MAG: 3,4-dihydroxyphenylacetate 2,3-dioxygenase [Thermoplasmata archaeon YP2-bin.285]|uniref:3,4-dihydroxyphenylacetate 2,3-dioxygenase n=1 Tax=Candidatus Sysuiplasma superficiale TaxID=2823368 RepID=A0A8J8CDU2_9ARCH|nr:3,4-dihydroxyphenylacetate 2,3-dioxygenase [Candidatus Sysuiplasma superficiale]